MNGDGGGYEQGEEVIADTVRGGFSLIKGRTDVGQLSSPAAAVVGLLLAGALIAGATAAGLLMRAAHGRPFSVALREVSSRVADPVEAARRVEADASEKR